MAILQLTAVPERPWDFAGIGVSLICVTHCLATPFLVGLLPALELLERETHTAFVFAILCIGLLAFVPGYRHHNHWRVPALGLIGIGMLSAGVAVPEGLMNEASEMLLTVFGGITLILAHIRNAYYCLLCRVCGKEPCHGKVNVVPNI